MSEEKKRITSRDCILQLIRTRMASRHAMQRLLRNSNAGITFEMLQVMSCLWSEQGISQQTLYVCRHEDPKDRRNKLVYLTDKGEAFHQWIAPTLAAYYKRLEDILGIDKLQQTEELLKELQYAIEGY